MKYLPGNLVVRRIRMGMNRTFRKLENWSCLKPSDLKEFSCYRSMMGESLNGIERKYLDGRLNLLDLKGFPQIASFPGYHIRAAIFIGSFDPFQMTHLAMALRFLASDAADADVVFVVPEGGMAQLKPDRSDYGFRFEVLRLQVADIFQPLIVPLDIGRDADTVEIIRRFISLFPGSRMSLYHLMGTDSLPLARKYGAVDRETWENQASQNHVKLEYRIFALRRGPLESEQAGTEARLRESGFPVVFDNAPLCMPCSTDLRRRAVFTILFPSSSILRRVEVLFRYSMNNHWDEPSEPDYQI